MSIKNDHSAEIATKRIQMRPTGCFKAKSPPLESRMEYRHRRTGISRKTSIYLSDQRTNPIISATSLVTVGIRIDAQANVSA